MKAGTPCPMLKADDSSAISKALVRLYPLGIQWGTYSVSLDDDLAIVKKTIWTGPQVIMYYTPHRCLLISSSDRVAKTLNMENLIGTPVNSLDHFISYLRRHGVIKS